MARLFLIIDGYNLLHKAGFGRSTYGPGDLERARMRLLQKLTAGLEESAARDTTVVFDSTQTEAEDSRQQVSSRLMIRYSSHGRDADAEIELLLESHSSPKQVLVISSDHRLHKAARRRRARCIDSEEFLRLLETPEPPWKANRQKSRSPQKNGLTRKHEAELPKPPAAEDPSTDFAQDFLNIDVDEIKRSVRKEKQ